MLDPQFVQYACQFYITQSVWITRLIDSCKQVREESYFSLQARSAQWPISQWEEGTVNTVLSQLSTHLHVSAHPRPFLMILVSLVPRLSTSFCVFAVQGYGLVSLLCVLACEYPPPIFWNFNSKCPWVLTPDNAVWEACSQNSTHQLSCGVSSLPLLALRPVSRRRRSMSASEGSCLVSRSTASRTWPTGSGSLSSSHPCYCRGSRWTKPFPSLHVAS